MKMPALFIGHGNPMNAITDNPFRRSWLELGPRLPRPRAILCVSAHWLSRGTFVTMADPPRTIHDFGGFPAELYEQQYPARGAPDAAQQTIETILKTQVLPDTNWGLDHGAWSVLKSLYPAADVPVFQLSIDHTQPAQYHFDLASELAPLREQGVLILASGNVVHNLRALQPGEAPQDWALDFDAFVKSNVEQNNSAALIDYHKLGAAAKMSVPTNDHYLPLIYLLALRQENDQLSFFTEAFDMASISMRSVLFTP